MAGTLGLLTVAITPPSISVVIADSSGVPVFSATVPSSSGAVNTHVRLNGLGNYADCRGTIVFGRTESTAGLPAGIYTFDPSVSVLEPCSIRPDLSGVRSISVTSSGRRWRLSNNVNLVQGANTRIVYDEATNSLTFSAIDGEGFVDDCDCEPNTPPCVQMINGISAGVFEIVGDGGCTDVSVSGNRITIRNTCAEPCCGCPELEALTEGLNNFAATVQRLEEYSALLDARMHSLDKNMDTILQGP
jgi:hypothetical protein